MPVEVPMPRFYRNKQIEREKIQEQRKELKEKMAGKTFESSSSLIAGDEINSVDVTFTGVTDEDSEVFRIRGYKPAKASQ